MKKEYKEIISDINKAILVLNELKKIESEKLVKMSECINHINKGVYSIKKAEKSFQLFGKLAKVKEGTNWIYEGHTFEIIEVYIIHSGEFGIFEKGSMDLRLNLVGTKFEYSENFYKPDKPYHNTSTVINTKDLVLL